MPIDRQFVINRQGKDFVLYAGLLDAAHAAGLVSIETHLAQIPGPENGHVAICTATVRLVDANGTTRSFTGIGDADSGNVNRMVANALIRMGETRAKARALRDALNVTAELLDELADASTQIDVPDQPDRPRPKATTPAAATQTPSAAPSPSASVPAAATASAPAPNAVQPHPLNQPPATIRSATTARAQQAQDDELLSLALGYRARPDPGSEAQLRKHLTHLIRAAELNGLPLHLSHEPADLTPAVLGPTILEIETRMKAQLHDRAPGTIQPAVPPKARPAAGG